MRRASSAGDAPAARSATARAARLRRACRSGCSSARPASSARTRTAPGATATPTSTARPRRRGRRGRTTRSARACTPPCGTGMRPARRPPAARGAGRPCCKGTWVREGYRDDEQERRRYRRALGWLERYVATLDPGDEPLGVERMVPSRPPCWRFTAGSTGSTGPATASWSSSTTRPAAPGWTPTTPAARRRWRSTRTRPSGCSAGRAAGSSCTTCRPAPSPRTSTPTSRWPGSSPGRGDRARHHGRRAGGGRRRRPRRGVPGPPGPLCGWCDFRRTCPWTRRRQTPWRTDALPSGGRLTGSRPWDRPPG